MKYSCPLNCLFGVKIQISVECLFFYWHKFVTISSKKTFSLSRANILYKEKFSLMNENNIKVKARCEGSQHDV